MQPRSSRRWDEKLIYVLIVAAISAPMLFNFSMPPVRLAGAEKAFSLISSLQFEPKEIVFVALDFGPGTQAENRVQAEVFVEHLLRKRIPFAVFSLYYLAEPYLATLPERVVERLQRELPQERWEYGVDWVNLGYRPGAALLIQNIPKSKNLPELFNQDARGNDLRSLPVFRGVQTLRQIKVLAEFTGLLGVFDTYVQYFQSADYRPIFIHGCTSITIPEAYIYLDSGQIRGLFEGAAGAAWYSELLSRNFLQRAQDDSAVVNTMLGFAHIVIMLAILAGNVMFWAARRRKRKV